MANENLRIDENTRWVLGAITNDVAQEIKNARINPVTGRLIVEANVTSNNTQIGSTIPGGTEGSVLFLGVGSTLDEDNANFFYDSSNAYLGLGINTPTATLHVDGSVRFDLGGDAEGDIYYRDATGNLVNLPIGTSGQFLSVSGGVPFWDSASGFSGYDLFQNEGSSVTQRSTINLTNLLTASDVSSKTQLTINVANLAADSAFLSNLDLANISGQIDLTTQVSGQLPAANINISQLESALNLSNISGTINLTTQVSGVLPVGNGGTGASSLSGVLHGNGTSAITAIPLTTDGAILIGDGAGAPTTLAAFSSSTGTLKLANGGTAASLSDPNANSIMGWDDTDNSVGFWSLGTGLSYNHSTHTLSASNSGINPTIQSILFDDFVGGSSTSSAGTSTIGELGWTPTPSSAITSVTGESNHPGVLVMTSNNSTPAYIYLGAQIGDVNVQGTYEFMVKLGASTSPFMCGITSNVAGSATGTDVCLVFKANGTNWLAIYGNGTSPTTVGSVATSTNWVRLTIVVNSAGNSVEFFVDGVSLGTQSISASGSTMKAVFSDITSTPSLTYNIDYFYMNQTISR